jgi:hypothetical protein
MEGERQMTVRGAPPAIESWVGMLSAGGLRDWSRADEIERRVKVNRDARWPICLVWSGEGRHPKTALFLQPVSDSEIAVTSVVPIDRKDLAPNDRSAALKAFHEAVVSLEGQELVVEDKPSAPDLPDVVSPAAVARFKTFVRTANKTCAHGGLDMPRWCDFLIQLHVDRSMPPRDVLERALRGEGFGEEASRQVVEVYDIAGDLLRRYDAFREKE